MIYLDLSLIANFLMDILLLWILYGRRRPQMLRLLLSAAIGSLLSVGSFLLPLAGWQRGLLSLPVATLMLLIAGNSSTPRLLGQDLFLLYIYSLMFSGMIPFMLRFFRVWLVAVALSYLFLRGFLVLGDRRKRTLRLTILWQDRRWTLNGLVDSGNLLREPFSGLPVIVVPISVLPGHPEPSYPVPYRTVDKESLLLAFRPDALLLDDRPAPPALIAPATDFVASSAHQALIPECLTAP